MLSRKTRYAIMALSILAREWGGDNAVPMSTIARDRHVPQRFLEGIFLQLRNASLLESVRGVSGGYRAAFQLPVASIFQSNTSLCGTSPVCTKSLQKISELLRPMQAERNVKLVCISEVQP